MQDSIKQQNTFTTIASAKLQLATVGFMNGSSILTQVYYDRHNYSYNK